MRSANLLKNDEKRRVSEGQVLTKVSEYEESDDEKLSSGADSLTRPRRRKVGKSAKRSEEQLVPEIICSENQEKTNWQGIKVVDASTAMTPPEGEVGLLFDPALSIDVSEGFKGLPDSNNGSLFASKLSVPSYCGSAASSRKSSDASLCSSRRTSASSAANELVAFEVAAGEREDAGYYFSK